MIELILSKFSPSDLGIMVSAVALVLIVFWFSQRSTQRWMDFIIKMQGCGDDAIKKAEKHIRKKAD